MALVLLSSEIVGVLSRGRLWAYFHAKGCFWEKLKCHLHYLLSKVARQHCLFPGVLSRAYPLRGLDGWVKHYCRESFSCAPCSCCSCEFDLFLIAECGIHMSSSMLWPSESCFSHVMVNLPHSYLFLDPFISDFIFPVIYILPPHSYPWHTLISVAVIFWDCTHSIGRLAYNVRHIVGHNALSLFRILVTEES